MSASTLRSRSIPARRSGAMRRLSETTEAAGPGELKALLGAAMTLDLGHGEQPPVLTRRERPVYCFRRVVVRVEEAQAAPRAGERVALVVERLRARVRAAVRARVAWG